MEATKQIEGFVLFAVFVVILSQTSANDATTTESGSFTYNGDYSSKQDCTNVVGCKKIVATISKSSNVVPMDDTLTYTCNAYLQDASNNLKDEATATYEWKVYDKDDKLNEIATVRNKDITVPVVGDDLAAVNTATSVWVPGKEYILVCKVTVDTQSVEITRVVKKEGFLNDYPDVFDKSQYDAAFSNWGNSYTGKVFKEIKAEETAKNIKILRDAAVGSGYNQNTWEIFDKTAFDAQSVSDVDVSTWLNSCNTQKCNDFDFKDTGANEGKKYLLKTSLVANSVSNDAKDAEEFAVLWFYKKKPDIKPPEPMPNYVKLGTEKDHEINLGDSKYEPADETLKKDDVHIDFECTKLTANDCDDKVYCDLVNKKCWFNKNKEDLATGSYTVKYRVCTASDLSLCSNEKTIEYDIDDTATDPVDIKKRWGGSKYVPNGSGKVSLKVDDSALSDVARRNIGCYEWKLNDVVVSKPEICCDKYKCRYIDIDPVDLNDDCDNVLEIKGANSLTKIDMCKKPKLTDGAIVYDVGANFVSHDKDDVNKRYRYGFVDKGDARRQGNEDALWIDVKISLTDESDAKGSKVTFPPITDNYLWVNTKEINDDKEEYDEKKEDTTLADDINLDDCTKSVCDDVDKYTFLQKQYYDSYAPYCEKCQIVTRLWEQKDRFLKDCEDYEYIKATINLLYRTCFVTKKTTRRDLTFTDEKPPDCPDVDPNNSLKDDDAIAKAKELIDELILKLTSKCLDITSNVKCNDDISQIRTLVEMLVKLCTQYNYRMEEAKKLWHLYMLNDVVDAEEKDIVNEENSFIKTVVSDDVEKCLTLTSTVAYTDEYCFELKEDYTGKISVYQKESDVSETEKKKEFDVYTDENVEEEQVLKKLTATFKWADDIDVCLNSKWEKCEYKCEVNADRLTDKCEKPTISDAANTITCVCTKDDDTGISEIYVAQVEVTGTEKKDGPGSGNGAGAILGAIGWVAGGVGGFVLIAFVVAAVVIAVLVGVYFARKAKKDEVEVELEEETEKV